MCIVTFSVCAYVKREVQSSLSKLHCTALRRSCTAVISSFQARCD
jgi:hypothetical protein